MKNIKQTQKLVKEILEKFPQTRNSDMLLYYYVCLEIDKTILKLPFWLVLLDMKSYGLPPIESVGRARRKLQRKERRANLPVNPLQSRRLPRRQKSNIKPKGHSRGSALFILPWRCGAARSSTDPLHSAVPLPVPPPGAPERSPVPPL